VQPGFSTISTAEGDWRIYSTVVGRNIVQISEPTAVREQLAASLAFRTILPLLILVPVLIVVILVTVSRGLKPLHRVALEVGERSAGALDPLPDNAVPTEVKPLVTALNDLLVRLGRSLGLQRSFIADAAHELRTPLTAVRLQLQLAERANSEDERKAAFSRLKGGIDRAAHLIDQLLALARSEPDAVVQSLTMVSLADVGKVVIAERASIAESKSVDLGLSVAAPVQVMAEADSVRVMLGNLVDNAIQYTPRGGRIDVEIMTQEGQACVIVTDTGPGIPVEERNRVFDRFYRLGTAGEPGTGLGLAIVRAIARRHRASVELAAGSGGTGLKVTVRFFGE
jgi:two-component system OmpR family sensor kinase